MIRRRGEPPPRAGGPGQAAERGERGGRRRRAAFLLRLTGGLLAAGALTACGETRGLILGELPLDDAGLAGLQVDAGGCLGCPIPVNLGGQSDTAAQGGTTGTPYTDTCPAGQAVIGFKGFLTAPSVGLLLIGAIQAQCGALVVIGSDSTAAATVAGPTLPMRGTSIDSPWTQSCPANEVVVGFFGRSGADLDQIAFECARWTPSSDGGSDELSVSSTTVTSSGIGGDGGSPFQNMCPPGEVARGTSLRAEGWIDAFALVCGTPALASDSGAP
jgi:hypothetical protein